MADRSPPSFGESPRTPVGLLLAVLSVLVPLYGVVAGQILPGVRFIALVGSLYLVDRFLRRSSASPTPGSVSPRRGSGNRSPATEWRVGA